MSLLHISFAGAVMILAVTVIRALIIYRVPKKTFMVLWGITLARLLIPFSAPSAFSIYTFWENTEPIISNVGDTAVATLGPAIQEGQMTTVPNYISHSEVAAPIWPIIWAIGLLICVVAFSITYWKCYKEFQTSLPIDNDFTRNWLSNHHIKRSIEIRQSELVSAPLTFGIFRPVILMPKTTDWNDEKTLQYVLAHEFVHIRRFDTIAKLILLIALCVHWFNPFVWVMYVLANRDIELSCDETVLHVFGENTKASYARILIGMEEIKSGITPLCNNFSKNAIEERMTAIMKTKKRTVLSIVSAVLLVAVTTTVFATSAKTKDDEANPTTFGMAMDSVGQQEFTQEDILELYGDYGISLDKNGDMIFQGERVRLFWDGVDVGDNAFSVYYQYYNGNGTVDVHTVRSVVDNGDGSIDPFGELIKIEKDSQKVFEQRDVEADLSTGTVPSVISGFSGSDDGTTFAELMKKYAEFGIRYESGDGTGNIYYNNQLVKTFVDENQHGNVFTLSSESGGEIVIHTVYDKNGHLTGIEIE